MKLTEKDLQTYGTQLLEMDGWRRLRTDPVSDRRRGTGFGEIGMADDLYIRYRWTPQLIDGDIQGLVLVEVIWIEFKSPKGKPTKAQLAWHAVERNRGALTLIAGRDFEATPEGMYAWYKQSGLMRKAISPPKGAL